MYVTRMCIQGPGSLGQFDKDRTLCHYALIIPQAAGDLCPDPVCCAGLNHPLLKLLRCDLHKHEKGTLLFNERRIRHCE